MERIEQLDLVRRQLELAVSWSDKTRGAAGQESQDNLVTQRLEDVILKHQTGESKDMSLSLDWTTNKEKFSKTVTDNFGCYVDRSDNKRMSK